MTSRPVLVIHADPAARDAVRAMLAEHRVLEAGSRAEAMPLLSGDRLALVLSQPQDFRRLLRDLERHTPGTPRAVLCPEDPGTLRQLAELAAEGYEFATIPEGELDHVRQLIAPRTSARVAPVEALHAHFVAGGCDFLADVAEVSSDGLGLRLPPSAPVERLTPGLALERGKVVGPGGVVLEPRTWVVRTLRRERAGGAVLLGVSVEPSTPETYGKPPARIHDAVRVRGLFRRAVARRASFVLHMPDGSGRREYTDAAFDTAGRLVLSRPRPGHEFGAGEIARVAFELLGTQVEAMAAVVEALDERVVLPLPRTAQRRERREALRVRPGPDEPGFVTLRSPLTQTEISRALVDLHPLGASFELESAREALPPGLVLNDVELGLGARRVRVGAVVQSCQPVDDDGARRRVGLRLTPASDGDRQALIDAWLERLVPDVACGSRVEFRTIWALFEHEQVRFPDYPFEAPRTLEVLDATHRAVGDGRHGLGKAFVFHEGGEVLGHASGLRTHTSTWLAQHLVVRSGYHRQTQLSQALVNLSFDYAEALGDIEYLRGLWRTSNRWPSRVFGTVTSKLLRPGESHLASFHPMRRAIGPVAVPRSVSARAATDEDLGDFVAHLRGGYDPVFLRGHDLVERELRLEQLGARYRGAGLRRERLFGTALRDGRAIGWVVLERSSPGLFWAEWYNAFRVFLAQPGEPDASEVRQALVAWALGQLAAEGETTAEAIVDPRDVSGFVAMGFADLGCVMEYTAHRSLTREITAQVVAVFEKLSAREQRGTGEGGRGS